MFDSPEYKDNFVGPAQLEVFSMVIEGSEELVVDRALSKSYVTSLPEEVKAEVVENIRKIVKRGDGKVWIAQEMGTFEYPYATGKSC